MNVNHESANGDRAGGDREFRVIDAFTTERFSGNPAAVLLNAEGLSDKLMQSIAREFNLSETTFILPPTEPDATVRFRWFTPAREVNMCGHATLAGIHALVETGRYEELVSASDGALRIETRSGVLAAKAEMMPGEVDGRLISFDLPEPRIWPDKMTHDEAAQLLRLPKSALVAAIPPTRTGNDDLIVLVQNYRVLNEARPRLDEIARLFNTTKLRAVCISTTDTLTPSIHAQSRFFAPAYGVPEDPVTGSVHGPLAALLVHYDLVPHRDGVAALSCIQCRPGGRSGLLRVMVERDEDGSFSAILAGQAVTTMTGTLKV